MLKGKVYSITVIAELMKVETQAVRKRIDRAVSKGTLEKGDFKDVNMLGRGMCITHKGLKKVYSAEELKGLKVE